MEQRYLRIENERIVFVVKGQHTILEGDVQITNEDYDEFFKLQRQGKQFKLKEKPTGSGLFDYIEEFVLEVIIDNTPTTEERIKALEMALLEVL